MGGRYHGDVYRDFLFPANAPYRPFLQHPQQLALEVFFHVPYLIEEYRTSCCQFKKAFLFRFCICKGALFIPEELAFKEGLRQSSAVYSNKGGVVRFEIGVYQLMNMSGHELFTRSAFSGDKYR